MPISSLEAGSAAVRSSLDRLKALGWYHSLRLPSGEVIEGVQTLARLELRIAQFEIPQDLTGKRVLDVGAWDGWFTFEMERRGASVVAIDLNPGTNFLTARRLMNSRAEYRIMDVLDLSPDTLGFFDIVLCFGVLYHLKHPLLALERLYSVSSDRVLIESYVSESDRTDGPPRMEFYEGTELCGQFDNWVGPNVKCLLAWCRATGFATARLNSVLGNRAHVSCSKKWPDSAAPTSGSNAYIVAVQNATTDNHRFRSTHDEYISIWFDSPETGLTVDEVFPSVGAFGIRPVAVALSAGAWLANLKVPSGLAAGWYLVALRVRDGSVSNTVRIGINNPAYVPEEPVNSGIEIVGLADNASWERGKVRLGPGSCVAAFIAGIPEMAVDRGMFELFLNGTTLPCIYASPADGNGVVQINALVPRGLEPGIAQVQARFLDIITAPVELILE